jgi:hypothetical protein
MSNLDMGADFIFACRMALSLNLFPSPPRCPDSTASRSYRFAG